MGTTHTLEADLAYVKQLIGAGWAGIASARRQTDSGEFMPPPKTAPWMPTMLGAALGMLGARLVAKRRHASGVAMGGMVGSIVGFGAAMAWASRVSVGLAARGAIHSVNAVRDERWLAMNPIDYA